MATAACGDKELVYATPPLNEQDAKRLTCSEFPSLQAAVESLPPHEFLSGLDGEPVVTPDGKKWVSFDVVQQRELVYIEFGAIDGRVAHFSCADNLEWLADLWTSLERDD